MDSNGKQVDHNGFTKEVEEAIDDLFSPTKAIEIDPVTSEVREVEPEQASGGSPSLAEEWDLGFEDVLEGGQEKGEETDSDAAAEEAPLRAGAAGSGEEGAEAISLDLELEDLELGLEIEEEASAAPEEVPAEEEVSAVTPGQELEQKFNHLYEAVLALEWEVGHETIGNLREAVEDIRLGLASVADGRGERLNEILKWVMEVISSAPEKLHPAVPKLLARAIEMALGMVRDGDDGLLPQLDAVLDELAGHLVLDSGEEGVIEPEEAEDVKEGAVVEESASSIVKMESDDERSEVLIQTVRVHLAVLDECIRKMKGLEEILLQAKGLEKLLQFNAWIHARLEGERAALQEALEGREYDPERVQEVVRTTFSTLESAVKLSDVQAETARLEEAERKDEPAPRPPFSRLLVAERDEDVIGFLPDEVCLSLSLSRKLLKALDGAAQFPLAKLKKWPWSKLSGLFEGELAAMGEGALKNLTLPVLLDGDGLNLDGFINPALVVLFKEGKGGVAVVEGLPQEFTVKEEDKWSPSSGHQRWFGVLTMSEKEIRVFSVVHR